MNADVESPHPFSSNASYFWSIPRPWNAGPSSSKGLPGAIRTKKMSVQQPYDLYLKKTLPFVSLCLDQPGRIILVDHTINNIYIKVPVSVVSVQSILSAVATKIGCEANELIMLDVKFLEISDDKGEVYLYPQCSNHDEQCFLDLEYWKVPSRRIYITNKGEYEDIIKTKALV